jgi:NAD(P)-dependent dehydrogenase (short-subunit alcohol dehydrogenase family)
MMNFDGKVAIVTGAGGGIGRSHALLLASRGAQVVVNDTGGQVDGSEPSAEVAAAVVGEIEALGGRAVADTSSVATPQGGAAMVRRALDSFGRIDIVVHNAGVAGKGSVAKLSDETLRRVLDVHLLGAFHVTGAAWPHLMAQRSGRVVLTASGVGVFGMAGASAYGAAKMGVVGLTRCLALEGATYGIGVNAVAPIAQTRMAGDVFGPLGERISPDLVAAVVAFLAHESCDLTGRVLSAGGGRVAELFIGATRGYTDEALTPELVAANLAQVTDRDAYEVPTDAMAEVAMTAAALEDDL